MRAMTPEAHHSAAELVREIMGVRPGNHLPEAPTLPAAPQLMFTMTEDQLHDLAYHAVTTYMRNQPARQPSARIHTHATRVAGVLLRHARASDYTSMGVDPHG
jgi:hypothetical protein